MMKRSGRAGHQVDDVGQIDQVVLVDLDQAQALRPHNWFRQALISDDLPVPRAPVSSTLLAGRPATNCRVFCSICCFLRVDLLQVRQARCGAMCAPAADSRGRLPRCLRQRKAMPAFQSGARCGLRQHRFDARQQGFGAHRGTVELASCDVQER